MMKASLFMPMTLVSMDIIEKKQNSSFHTLKEVRCEEPLTNIAIDFNKQAIACFVAEVLYKTINDDEAHLDLFDFITHLLRYIDAEEKIRRHQNCLNCYRQPFLKRARFFFNIRIKVG